MNVKDIMLFAFSVTYHKDFTGWHCESTPQLRLLLGQELLYHHTDNDNDSVISLKRTKELNSQETQYNVLIYSCRFVFACAYYFSYP